MWLDWNNFIRGNFCEICKFSKYPEVLQVHHIDHDRKNNKIDNLKLLCPTCHMIQHISNGKLNLKYVSEHGEIII